MPISKTKIGKTGGKNTNTTPTTSWDGQSKVDEYDGRANLQAGDKGKEPGGRWSKAYYETPAVIIGRNITKAP